MSYLTGMEDWLYRKQIEFLYIGKNVSENYKIEICSQFNQDSKFQVCLVDYSEDLSSIQFEGKDQVGVFGECIWVQEWMEMAEATV